MGDGLKLTKDKRHRSSSSLAGVILEGTQSERKLDIRVSIPEVDDQFAVAEARCDDLQEKIDMVKSLKRKRKLKKRSMTRLIDPPAIAETVPFVTIRTQPKKTLMVTEVSQQATRLRQLDIPQNPTRGYLDPATVEQHHMIGQMHGYDRTYRPQQEQTIIKQSVIDQKTATKPHVRRARADGDYTNVLKDTCGQRVQYRYNAPLEVACGDDELADYSDNDIIEEHNDALSAMNKRLMVPQQRYQVKSSSVCHRRHVPREQKEGTKWSNENAEDSRETWRASSSPVYRRRQNKNRTLQNNAPAPVPEERPVVELFSKAGYRSSPSPDAHLQYAPTDKKNKRTREPQPYEDQTTGPLENVMSIATKKAQEYRHPRRVKYRSRRYELPTVASQMKQAGMRYSYGNANHTNIPFVVSKSTAPSHNIGVNIQQVLNGIKVQQPLSGIPLTIAHHMGLGHIPFYDSKSTTVQPSLDNHEINAIKVGRRILRLPSYKYMSYNRLLTLYREGDGMVSRFLRAISRPHYFYTSMYNSLNTNREDLDGATSKGRAGSQEAKQSLAEYATLYREYEHIEKCIKEGNCEPELERRKEELSREMAAREDYIRRVVQEYRSSAEIDQSVLRASASTAEDGYRHSTFKLNLGERQQ
ncbi:uncharacterized protein LOC113518214 isoform X3 [Galleria mellonella]|uniref:Uncharacterized protein LOC113518214 isoform X3 n=1 Tax=Galleria mellonella TaxID=7137 RepID=A0A6J3C919_GALME|nr:uncharacterized protein LOC113518214 isoform X3 [Galleria mellonella]